MQIGLLFKVIALVCFTLAALNVSSSRVGLVPAGLAFLTLSLLF